LSHHSSEQSAEPRKDTTFLYNVVMMLYMLPAIMVRGRCATRA